MREPKVGDWVSILGGTLQGKLIEKYDAEQAYPYVTAIPYKGSFYRQYSREADVLFRVGDQVRILDSESYGHTGTLTQISHITTWPFLVDVDKSLWTAAGVWCDKIELLPSDYDRQQTTQKIMKSLDNPKIHHMYDVLDPNAIGGINTQVLKSLLEEHQQRIEDLENRILTAKPDEDVTKESNEQQAVISSDQLSQIIQEAYDIGRQHLKDRTLQDLDRDWCRRLGLE